MSQSSSDEKGNSMEDYFFSGTVEPPRSNQVYALIIYDIINNKKRTGFAKFMSGFGRRVQKSCFEVRISQKSFDKLLKQIGYYCDMDDNILNFPTTKITPIPRKYWHRVGYKAFLDNKIAPVLGIMESATNPIPERC